MKSTTTEQPTTPEAGSAPPLRTSDWLGSLSPEARTVLEGMVHYCLDNGVGMGMDEGWHERTNKHGDPVKTRKRKFRTEIEAAFNYPNIPVSHGSAASNSKP